MSTLTKPYEAQQFEAREAPSVGDPLLRAELEMDRLQKQLQAVKVEKANLQEKVLACAMFELSLCIPYISLIRVHCNILDCKRVPVYCTRTLAGDRRIGAGGGTCKPTETSS